MTLRRRSRCWTLWSDGLLRIHIPAWDNWNLVTIVHNFHYAQWILIENRSQFLIFNFLPSDPKYRIRAWGLLATCNQEIPSPQRDYRLLSSLHFQSTFPPRLATRSLTKGSLVLTSKVDSLSISSYHPAPLLKLLRYETAKVLIRKYHENPQSSLYSRRLEVMGARKNGCLRRPPLFITPITSKRLLRGLNLKGN